RQPVTVIFFPSLTSILRCPTSVTVFVCAPTPAAHMAAIPNAAQMSFMNVPPSRFQMRRLCRSVSAVLVNRSSVSGLLQLCAQRGGCPMHHVRQSLAVVLMVLMGIAPAVAGDQQHVVSPAQLAAAVRAQVAQQDADRAAIREALAKPQVRAVAKKMNIDMARVTTVADTLSGADLSQAADAARQVNHQLVGGASTVVISTTTIIIVLLLIILLVVVVKA